MSKHVDSRCSAFQLAIDVLGKPWTALILNLLQRGPMRFNELATAADGPTDKVLSARLKELERQGLILREVEPGPPVRVTYALTSCGRGFGEVAASIQRWGRSLPRRA